MYFWLLLFLLPLVWGDIDFMDCGSKNVIVDKIDIPGCHHAPCRVYKGKSYHLYITPDLLGPDVEQIRTYATVVMWGAHIPIPSECDEPCITTNHFLRYGVKSRLNLNIKFPVKLLDRPAELYLWAEYRNRGKREKKVCVALPIDIH